MDNFRKIRSRIVDEESRIIYDNRLSYSLSGEQKHIFNMLEQIDGIGNILRLKERLIRERHKKFIIFGAGYNGIFIRQCMDEFNWAGFLDNKVDTKTSVDIVVSQTTTLDNLQKHDKLPIYNPRYYIETKGINNNLFIICVPGFKAQISISAQLQSLGVKETDIYAFNPSNVLVPQYFQTFSPYDLETFVDCGTFDGETTYDFARWCRGNYRKIFAFEADNDNHNACKTNLSKLADVFLYNYGVWCTETTLRFNNTSTGFSSIHEKSPALERDNITEIQTCVLDNILKDEEITFIKMDIEGAEYNALLGAEQIISKQKPRLAICVYHKFEDIWEIPELLLKFNSSYKFRLRHYGPSAYETVLYAE